MHIPAASYVAYPFLPVKTNVCQDKQTAKRGMQTETHTNRKRESETERETKQMQLQRCNSCCTQQRHQLHPAVVAVDVGGCCFGRHFTQWHSHNQDKCPAAEAATAEVAALATQAATATAAAAVACA